MCSNNINQRPKISNFSGHFTTPIITLSEPYSQDPSFEILSSNDSINTNYNHSSNNFVRPCNIALQNSDQNIKIENKPDSSDIRSEYRFNQRLSNSILGMNMFHKNKQFSQDQRKNRKLTTYFSINNLVSQELNSTINSGDTIDLQDIPFIDDNVNDYSPEEQLVQKIEYLKLKDQTDKNTIEKFEFINSNDPTFISNSIEFDKEQKRESISSVVISNLSETNKKHQHKFSDECMSVYFPKNIKTESDVAQRSKLNELHLKLDLSCLHDSDGSDNSIIINDNTININSNSQSSTKFIVNPLEKVSHCKFCSRSLSELEDIGKNNMTQHEDSSTSYFKQDKDKLTSPEKKVILMQLEEWSRHGIFGQNIYDKGGDMKKESLVNCSRNNDNTNSNKFQELCEGKHDNTVNIYAVNNFCEYGAHNLNRICGNFAKKYHSTPYLDQKPVAKQKFPYAYIVKSAKTKSNSCPDLDIQSKSLTFDKHFSTCLSQKLVKSAPSIMRVVKLKNRKLNQNSTPRYGWFEFKNCEKNSYVSASPSTEEEI